MAGFGWRISSLKPGNRPPQMVFLTVPMAVEYFSLVDKRFKN